MTLKKDLPKDPDLANVEKALRRAGKAARELARKTHTPCYVVKEGKIVNVAEGQTKYRPEKKNSERAGN